MALITVPGVNLNAVTAWDGEANILPPGEYAFEVVACALGNSSKGNPQLEMDLIVIGAADGDTLNGAKKKHWVVITEGSAGRVRNIVDACGVSMNEAGVFDSDHFVGKSFIAEVFEDSWEKPNLGMGGTDIKTNSKLRKERPVSAGWSDVTAPAAPAVSPPATPAATPPAKAAVPAARVTIVQPTTAPRQLVRAPIPSRKQ